MVIETGEPELEQIRIRGGSYWWNALYQQRPSPDEGLLFQRHWLLQTPQREQPHWGQQKLFSPLVLSCDLSFNGGEGNDYCAFVLLGLIPEQRAVHPAVEAHGQGLQLHRTAASTRSRGVAPIGAPSKSAPSHRIEVLWSQHHHMDLPGGVKFLGRSLAMLKAQGLGPDAVLIEDAANGPAVCQLLQRQFPGLIALRPVGSKVSRAQAVAPLLEAGQLGFALATTT